MSVPLTRLVAFLDKLLPLPAPGNDPSNNGLQVQGDTEVREAVFGVDASMALFRKAQEQRANFVFVHHGLSWKGGIRRLTGIPGARVAFLMQHGISLYASHLPLDAHPEVGHNARMSEHLGITSRKPFFYYGGIPIGWHGPLPEPLPAAALQEKIRTMLGTPPRIYGDPARTLRSIGIVSGGAADAVESAAELGLDALLTGEVGHEHVHVIAESGVLVFEAGHYASECPGVVAVMQRIRAEFALPCSFVDLPTGK